MSLNLSKKTINRACLFFLIVFTLLIISTGCDSSGSGSDDEFTLTFGGDTYVLSKIYVDTWDSEGDNIFAFQIASEGINIEENSGSGAVVGFEINIGSAEVPSGVYDFSDFADAGLYVVDGAVGEYDITSGEVEISVSSGNYSVSGSVIADTVGEVDFIFSGQSSGNYLK